MSENRKLQQIGGNSLYVSLPKHWTNKMQLKKGNKVTLVPQPDGSLHIYPAGKKETPREILLETETNDSKQSLKREIVAAYVDGFDVIKLKADQRFTDEQQEFIRETVDHLFGLELIEITGNTIVIQCLLKQDLPIEKTMQRIHSVIISMLNEIISALKEQNITLIKGLIRRMHDIKRLSLVTNRQLRSIIIFPRSANQREVSLIDYVDHLQVLHIIDEIADNVNKISECIIALGKQPLPKSILESLCQEASSIQDLYDQSIQSLFSEDMLLANRVLDSKLTLENLWKLCIKADEKSKISCLDLSYVYLLLDNLRQIQEYAVEIAKIALDRAEATTVGDPNVEP